MDIKQIEAELKTVRDDIKQEKELSYVYDILREYKGNDRIIPAKEAYEEIKKEALLNQNSFNFFTGLKGLDAILKKGFKQGQVIIISGPTGSGKTTFAQTLTHKFSEQNLAPTFFSFEMDSEEFFEKFGEKIPAFFVPRKMIENKIDWIEKRIIESKMKYGSKVFFVDHLHFLFEMEDMAKVHNLSLYVGMMMRKIKKICLAHNITIFLISHLKKTYNSEDNSLPDIDDLRDSSFIGQESDLVLFIKRKFEDKKPTPYATLKVAKNRRCGILGNVRLELINNQFIEYSDSITPETSQEEINNFLELDL